jgi:hypothetical protein
MLCHSRTSALAFGLIDIYGRVVVVAREERRTTWLALRRILRSK